MSIINDEEITTGQRAIMNAIELLRNCKGTELHEIGKMVRAHNGFVDGREIIDDLDEIAAELKHGFERGLPV